jgi:acetolactate synthase-1/2/3 large subunit
VPNPSAYITIPTITIPQLLLKYLQLEGVDTIFGIPGASFVNLLVELKNDRATWTYVVCKHETGAGYMADGFHRVSGGLGVVLTTAGPGATNALSGAMNAQAGHSSVLVITGEQPQADFGLDWEQEGVDLDLDVVQIYKSAVAYSAMINDPTDFGVLMRQALRDAQAVPGQCVHLSVPHDIMSQTVTNVQFPTSSACYRRPLTAASADDARTVAGLVASAKRPAILIGNGARAALRSGGLATFQSMVERFAIPVGTTADAKALFPETHPLSLRSLGYPACPWAGLYFAPPAEAPHRAAYDLLLVIGSSMGDFATNLWSPAMVPAGPFIQVDANQKMIGRSMPTTMGVIAEVGAFLDALAGQMATLTPDAAVVADRQAYLQWMKTNNSPYVNPQARASDATPIRPERAMAIVSEIIPPGSHIFPDAGNSCGWTTAYLEVDPPSEMHAALNIGAMGYATSAVVGAKLAAPDRTCLSIGGDGSFLMHGMEVSTAKQYGAGAIWMVWSENDLNMVSQSMAANFPDPVWNDYYKLGNPDLVKVAEGLGADSYAVHSPDDLKNALRRAIDGGQKGRPQVIVVYEDPSAVPPFNYPPTKS